MNYLLRKSIKLLLLCLITVSLMPVTAWAGFGGGGIDGTEMDAHSPNPGVLFYTRETPIILYNNTKTSKIDAPVWAWTRQYTSIALGLDSPTSDRSNTLGLTYLLKNDDMTFAPNGAENNFILPAISQAGKDNKVPVSTVANDQEAIYATAPMPAKSAFDVQEAGVTTDVSESYGLTNPTEPNTLGEQYYPVAGTQNFVALYHQLEYDKNYMNNWQEAKGKFPYWDIWQPVTHRSGGLTYLDNSPAADHSYIGFYWGRNWHPLLGVKDRYGATYTVPGVISCIAPSFNLALSNMILSTGGAKAIPGQTVMGTVTVTNAWSGSVTTCIDWWVGNEKQPRIADITVPGSVNGQPGSVQVPFSFTAPIENGNIQMVVNPDYYFSEHPEEKRD